MINGATLIIVVILGAIVAIALREMVRAGQGKGQ